jgi:hypothetical protein
MRRTYGLLVAVVTAVVVLALIVAAEEGGWFRSSPTRPAPPTLTDFHVRNVTSELGPVYAHGAPQAFGYNGSAALVTGVVGDPVQSTVPYPLLGTLGGLPHSDSSTNLSAQVAGLFHGGDTLGIAWNGSAWLITGEAAWGNSSGGAAAALSGGIWTNLTPVLQPYFSGQGGIWFDAWNGSSWLLGGASGSGAALVALRGSTVYDLTPTIPNNRPDLWIQYIGWNGSGWLVGGKGVFGAVTGNRFVDLNPGSEFVGGGMFAADWNGSAWLVGGGTPGAIEYLRGIHLAPAPRLPASFSWWVNDVNWDGRGWFIGGEGESPGVPYDSALVYLDASTGTVLTLSSLLPGAFAGGQIEFAALSPFYGPGSVLFIGQGALRISTGVAGPSEGAAATVVRG